jgi:hypothetical protein
MTSTDTPDASQHNPGPDHQVPDHRKKTHIGDAINALLKNLPRTQKVERNKKIEFRNSQRTLGRAYRQQNPQHSLAGERYSSDESLITLSDTEHEPPSASQQAKDFFAL